MIKKIFCLCAVALFTTSGVALGLQLTPGWGKNKQEVGGPKSGPVAPYYSASPTNFSLDPEDVTITFVREPSQAMPGAESLRVKDGNLNPARHRFGLSLWNWKDDVGQSDFWPRRRGISHVSKSCVSVPEPATLFLLGTALAGLAILRRRSP